MDPTAHQPPRIARANGIELCYEIFGDADAEPMLLIMGLAAQMIHWDDEFCRQLAARGFRVIRFDNRDIGKSSRMTGGKRLGALELLKLRFLKIPVAAPYTLRDMAEDTVGLMDVLGIKSAHLVGASMGGMIAQEIAISFPQRVRSLTSIMSTTGNPKVPGPTREASTMLMAPPPATKEEYFERYAQTWKILRAGSFPQDEAAAPCGPRLGQPQGAAGIGQGAHAGDSRHRRSPGAARRGQGHGSLDPRRKAPDDRRHGSRAADPDVAAGHRCNRQACACGLRQGDALGGRDETRRRMLLRAGALRSRGRSGAEGAMPLPRVPIHLRRLSQHVCPDAARRLQLYQGNAQAIYA
jgi:pimeloyl-ACP methyl ester carboxylesterase